MKIYLINPNCSELIVRTGLVPKDFEAIKDDVASIMKNTTIRLRVAGVNRFVHIDALVPGETEYGNVTLASSNKIITKVGQFDPLSQKRSTIQVKELESFKGIVELYHPGSDESIELHEWGEGEEMVISISDCDRKYYPLITEVMRAMNYKWHPYGGGSRGFEEWCEENGYRDVLDNKSP